MAVLQAIILGIIEGLTEFLPISSTGHLIVAENVINYKDVAEIFTVVVQLGALAAVLWFYRKDLQNKVAGLFNGDKQSINFWKIWIIATIPAGLAGLLIESKLSSFATIPVIATTLVIGGAIIWLIETYHKPKKSVADAHLEDISTKQAWQVGFYQVLALVPGVSRSGATIMGGLMSGLDRVTATAFSFYMSIPILLLAGFYKLLKDRDQIAYVSGGGAALIAGTVAAFITALLVIGWLLKKVAIVHDWLVGGGAEKVVEALHNMYPDAPIYTSYCTDEWRKRLNNKVVTGYLQNWPFSKLRKFLPLIRGWWFKSLDLSQFDLVISSSGNGEAKQISVPKNTLHVNYCHSPAHFYWDKYDEYLKHPSFRPHWLASLGLRLLVKPLRNRDYKAAQKVNYFIANSSHIKEQIKKYYGQDAVVIYPPVDVGNFGGLEETKTSRKGFIVWGRHVPYKRFDLAIGACNELGLPLKIVGTGPETEQLKRISGPTIEFTGRISDDELYRVAHKAEAFLFPGEEDFGIAPVEALAAGLPVVAYKSGGALDYVHENKTGTFFDRQTVSSLIATLKNFDSKAYSSKYLRNR